MKVKRSDLILIGVLLFAALAALFAIRAFREEGSTVAVLQNGTEIGRYPLNAPMTLLIEGEQGQQNTLIIKDGRAAVSHATCPDGICAAHAPVSQVGETIVCLPHRLVITVESNDQAAPDIIS